MPIGRPVHPTKQLMTFELLNSTASKALTAIVAAIVIACSSSDPAWQEKNRELIKQHNLTVRELPDLPEANVASNLEPAKVTSLDSLADAELYPGVKSRTFWGSGTMVTTHQLEPGVKLPEETLAGDRLVFVLEGSIDQLVNGSALNMIGQRREDPDGIHSGTPRTDFVYLEKG